MEDRCPGERIRRGKLLMMVRRLVRLLDGIGTTRPDPTRPTNNYVHRVIIVGLPQRFSHKSIIHRTVI